MYPYVVPYISIVTNAWEMSVKAYDCQVHIPWQSYSHLWRRLLEKRKENL